jgi:bacillithiol biosynthesis cysteine-adding enzyme BshC
MTEPIVRTEPLGGSPLARAAIEGRHTDWYVPRPQSAEAWRVRAEHVRTSFKDRGWLDALAPAFAPTGAANDRLARVANGNGIVVTTGQQPGLFGGPIYTWSKALSALALADAIEAASGVPTAPVFWAATDDADFAEASWTAVAMPGGAEKLALPPGAALGRTMADMPLGDASDALATLARACGATIDERALAAARAAYRGNATVGSAYVTLLRELFEPLGIAVLDASHPAVTGAARPFLVRALERADAVADALRARDESVVAAGYTTQVTEVEGLSLVFERAGVGAEKRRIPRAEAAAAVAAASGTLSPNVLLRPVVERAILPTATYVGGPGEIAYFAQVSAVARALDLEAPMVVPRWSVTIIEPQTTRLLNRLGVTEAELAEPHKAEGRLASAAVPIGVARGLDELRADLDRRSAALTEAAKAGNVPLPPEVVEGARRSMQHRVNRLERRVVAAVKRREAEMMTDIGTARGALYPLGTRQERALNIIPILTRHGSSIITRMLDAAGVHARGIVEPTSRTDGARAVASSRSALGDTGMSAQHVDRGRTADA